MLRPAPNHSAAHEIQGSITGLAGDVLHGWAFAPQTPDLRLAVEIYVDDACVAVVRADLDQGNDDTAGDGFHGFAVHVRKPWLKDGACLRARIANQGPWLDGDIRLPAQTPASLTDRLSTQVWHTGGLTLRGWAWDADAPTRHVDIHVLHKTAHGWERVLDATANRHHPALLYRATADHGFDIDLPWTFADGQVHTLALETDRGVPLTGSPISLCVHPEGARALLARACGETPEQPPVRHLLDTLLQHQDTLAPRSAGFGVYAQWHTAFQHPQPMQPHTGSTLVLLMGPGSAADEARSLHSLRQQRLPADQIRSLRLDDGSTPTALANFPQQLAAQLADPALACIIPLQRGDHLPTHALDTLLAALTTHQADWAYADCDQDDADGQRSNPWLKPAWDETLFYGIDLVTPGTAVSACALRRALQHLAQHGPQLPVCWHSLLAGVVASSTGPVIHVPQVLYHRSESAPAAPHQALPDATREQALHWLANQRVPGARLTHVADFPALTRVQWPLPSQPPTVSLIVPTRDQLVLVRTCVEGLLHHTDYPGLEIIVVDNDSRDADTLAWLDHVQSQGVRVLRYPQPFNYAAINNWAVEHAQGDIIGLINNDIAICHPDWLREMIGQLLRPGIGAVGARLLWPNAMVQHGGVVVGINGLAAHTGNHNDQHDPGYLGLNQVARQQSAVTAACLLVRKRDYLRHGGLDARRYPVAFNDVDFCLRLRESGLNLVWTPFATLTHAESASRGKEDSPAKAARAHREQRHFIQRWSALCAQGDPYYHPGLSADYSTGPYGGLALPPRPFAPRA
ncbi:glycosyltransferase [Thauera aromatica]|uniref:glycosyltransferase n=1 Tax=Thauera aromatica TaxID=59405 RepID=UPI001FFDE577|nr:glycosyltransferase [Thauera aromatica]MCK2097702.1 glycosyltransferase [Thauera aromatica]